MRRLLVVAALAVASFPVAASAWPPECDKYADKPCFTLCEIWHELEPLFTEPVPPVNGC